MQKRQPVTLAAAIERARRLIAAKRPVALVSSWGSNEELAAFEAAFGARFDCYVKDDWVPAAGRGGRGRSPDRRRQESEHAACRRSSRAEATRSHRCDADLVLVWGEGFDFAQLAARAKVILLDAYAQPENGHADVFIPISIQTERTRPLHELRGRGQRVRAVLRQAGPWPTPRRCSPRWRRVGASPCMIQDLVVAVVFIAYAIGDAGHVRHGADVGRAQAGGDHVRSHRCEPGVRAHSRSLRSS